MEHFAHPLCNATLEPAQGDEETVDVLHVQQGSAHGYRCVRSFWRPTPEEMVALIQGGCVCLTVLGSTHPPLSIAAMNPDVISETEQQTVARTVRFVVNIAEQSGYEVRVWQQPYQPLSMGHWHHAVEVAPRFNRAQYDPNHHRGFPETE